MSDEKKVERDCEVGYGKPPVASRFKPGISGNPSGKSKKKLERAMSDIQLHDDILGAMERKITIKRNGKTTEVPYSVALFESRQAAALKGDKSACKYVSEMHTWALGVRAKLLGTKYSDHWGYEAMAAEGNVRHEPLALEVLNKYRRHTRLK